jgi:hypothetical protein
MIVGRTREIEEIRIIPSSILCPSREECFQFRANKIHIDARRGIITTEQFDQIIRHETFETIENICTTLTSIRCILMRKNLNVSQTRNTSQVIEERPSTAMLTCSKIILYHEF